MCHRSYHYNGPRINYLPSLGCCWSIKEPIETVSVTLVASEGGGGGVAQLAECWHGKREALGSSPGRATIFSSPVTFGGSVLVRG